MNMNFLAGLINGAVDNFAPGIDLRDKIDDRRTDARAKAALLKSFQQHLVLEASWIVNGRHYGRTCNAWLKKQDDNMPIVRPIFEKTYAMMRLAQRVSVTFFAQVRRSSGHHVDGKVAWVLFGVCGVV